MSKNFHILFKYKDYGAVSFLHWNEMDDFTTEIIEII